ncbi:hypothetical protein ACQPYK_07525 [Streptosporangium sp. CA-135522]|uniref:hypothetical protein n=1 Tax=Streptosporangium sp. CA-135522 TaxID=3240072 RepID=UPI003D8DBB78
MDNSNGPVLLVIMIAIVLFVVGRRFQRTVDTWAGWGKAIQAVAEAAAKVPGAKSAAWAAVRGMIVVGLWTAALLAVIVIAIR